MKLRLDLIACLLLAGSCRSPEPLQDRQSLSYVGSSTVALFVQEADQVLPDLSFSIETEPESDGGERAMLAGEADLAGLAREPSPEVKARGVAAAMIGRDALAVIVSRDVELKGLSREQLRLVYSGQATNWSALGGRDAAINAFLVGPDSATRAVFQEQVMGTTEYAGVEVIEPDSAIIEAVASRPGSIGFISFAFLGDVNANVRPIEVDGHAPSRFDFEYPISRPLYLLWRPGTPGADRFVQWATSQEGQSVVLRHYPNVGVLGAVDAQQDRAQPQGTLVVHTDTFEVRDGDISYFPHRPYELFSSQAEFLKRVPNHRGLNDERPTPVHLEAGTYLVRVENRFGERSEFYATVRSGKTTVLHTGGKP